MAEDKSSKVVELTTGSTLSIEPLFSRSDFIFNKFILRESIGGSLPDIFVELRVNEDCCQLGDVLQFKIVNETGWCNKFDAYIYQLEYVNTVLSLHLTACNPEFVRDIHTLTYKGIDESIRGSYKSDIDSNVDTNINQELDIYQCNETNYDFLNNIMYGYRKDIIWGYSAGKLVIRDLRNWTEEYKLDRQEELHIIDSQKITDPKKLSYDIEVLEQFTNFTKIKFGKDIVDVDNRYLDLIENRVHNSKYGEFKSGYKFKTRFIPPLIICTNVSVYSDETNVENCFVTSREISVHNGVFICNFNVSSIKP